MSYLLSEDAICAECKVIFNPDTTEDECKEKDCWRLVHCRNVAKAQALHLLDEMEKPCPHDIVYTIAGDFIGGDTKHQCPICIAEARKEIEGK